MQQTPTRSNIDNITIQDLNDCYWAGIQIDALEESILQLETKARYRANSYAQPSHKGYGSRVEECAVAIDELEGKWRKKMTGYCRLITRVEEAIDKLPGNQSVILRLRYIEGLPWIAVAKRVNFDESWCRRLEREALKKLGLQR